MLRRLKMGLLLALFEEPPCRLKVLLKEWSDVWHFIFSLSHLSHSLSLFFKAHLECRKVYGNEIILMVYLICRGSVRTALSFDLELYQTQSYKGLMAGEWQGRIPSLRREVKCKETHFLCFYLCMLPDYLGSLHVIPFELRSCSLLWVAEMLHI